MASLRCHGNSDCNKTQIKRNFHLYVIQLWKPFFHIFIHGDLINAQTWEVSPQKIQSSHLKSLPNLLYQTVNLLIMQYSFNCIYSVLISYNILQFINNMNTFVIHRFLKDKLIYYRPISL